MIDKHSTLLLLLVTRSLGGVHWCPSGVRSGHSVKDFQLSRGTFASGSNAPTYRNAHILALEKEAEGLLVEIIGQGTAT